MRFDQRKRRNCIAWVGRGHPYCVCHHRRGGHPLDRVQLMRFIEEYLRLIIGVAIFAAVAVGALAYKSHANGLREEGREEIRAEWQAATNVELAARDKHIADLIDANQLIQGELNAIEKSASDLALDRARALSMRDKATRDAAIANAATGALREHAARAEDDIDRSQEDVERFGLEAVRASAAAYALDGTLRARRPMSMPSMPTSPFKPTE